MLAVGCSDGRLVIWDFLTRGIAKIICADWSPIYCISWSKKSDLIATSSTDNTVCIWNTSTGRCRTRISCIQSPIFKVQFHPRNSSYLLICPMKHPPVLIDNNGKHTIATIDDDSNDIISTFDRKGEHIILGNSRGLIVVKTFPDLKTISSFRITTGTTTNTVLRHIEIPRRGKSEEDMILKVNN
jgi:COMPASS component SWD1